MATADAERADAVHLLEYVRHVMATAGNDWGADRAGARLYGIFFGWGDGEYDAWTQIAERHNWNPGVAEQIRTHHATVARLLADRVEHTGGVPDLTDATIGTEWGVMRRLYDGPSDILAVADTRDAAERDLATRLEWLASLDRGYTTARGDEDRKLTVGPRDPGIAAIELVSRTVATWPDGGRYTGPWIADETETP